jgi:L,D-transpeptidase catalytic domain
MVRVFTLVLLVALLGVTPAVSQDGTTTDLVERLAARTKNLRPEVARLAVAAYAEGLEESRFSRFRLTIIDYSLPSYEKRLWVIDMETGEVLFEEIVAHGMGSPRGSGGDMEQARDFSNLHGSKKSSLGLFVTAETYQGQHGYTLRLDGLEEDVNDNARDRLIVIHSAHYVTKDRADDRLVGRSWGCPVVRPEISRELIDAIKDGSALWIYYPDEDWLEESDYLDED